MKLQYGKSSTYKHQLDEETLNELTNKTMRSKGQTQFLFNLVDGDYNKLVELEEQLKNTFSNFCPDTKEEVNEVMTKEVKNKWFRV